MSDLKIAIIGAGPAGCVLALMLLQASIQVTIFEGEASANARDQGGTLDLHEDTGIAALRRAGLYDEFLKHARFDAEATKIANKNLQLFLNLGGTNQQSSRGRPEIDRKQLRNMLVAALPEGTIRWGNRLRKIDEQLNMHFDQRVETQYDLIIGADGAWSKVRPLVSPVQPAFAGIVWAHLAIPDAENRYPDLHELVNRGSLFAYGDSKNINAQQLGDGSIQISAMHVAKEDWHKELGVDPNDADSLRKALLTLYNDWNPQLKKFLEVATDNPGVMSLYMLPVRFRWVNRPGVTLLGDAAHLMTPFAGEGVNLAMTDAMHLADAIIKTHKSGTKGSLTQNIKAYEENMFQRATKVQQCTFDVMSLNFFTFGAPDTTIEKWFYTVACQDIHWTFRPLLWAAICTYFWFFKPRSGV